MERDVSGLGASGLHCEESVTCVASPDRKDVGLLVGLEPVAVSRPIDEGLDTAGESLCDVSERRICWPLMQLDAELAADLRGEETTQAPGRGRSLTDLWHQISPQNKPMPPSGNLKQAVAGSPRGGATRSATTSSTSILVKRAYTRSPSSWTPEVQKN